MPAPYSDTQIANLALGRIGVSRTIASLDDRSAEAQAAKQWYAICRDAVLYDHPWPFASATATLALVQTDPSDEWGYRYRLPADCFRARYLVIPLATDLGLDPTGSINIIQQEGATAFEVTSDAQGGLLDTDLASPVTLKYTRTLPSPAFFSPSFALAVAWRLAAELAPSLARKPEIAQAMWQGYQQAVAGVAASADNEASPRRQPDAGSIRARI
jgi:hypothetical protein